MAKANASQAVDRAQQLIRRGQFRSASKITEQLAKAFPKNTQLLMMHASTLLRRGRYTQAIEGLTQALKGMDRQSPEHPLAIISIANAYTMMGDLNQAIEVLHEGDLDASGKPNAGIAAVLIDRYLDLDDQPSAQRVLDSMGIGNPLESDLHPSLACSWARAMKNKLKVNEIIASLEPIAQSASKPYAVSLMIGRLLEQAGEYDRAFNHYVQANQSNPPMHNRATVSARVDQIRGAFSKSTLDSLARPSHDKAMPRPILIVGMPRSGTSLVEQIISAHPDITAAGESQMIPELVGQMTTIDPRVMGQAALENFREAYLDELKHVVDSTVQPKCITDKNPMNLFLLGHALAFIPDAIVVRVQRDPRDICLSCFASPLAADHTYKFDLDDCANFAASAYHTLEHFKPIIQVDDRATWIDVSYEQLTQDPESQIALLFEGIGLEPHPDCFAFHKSTRAIQTISRDQVRQPMNTKSIARWEKFAHLPVIKSMLTSLRADGLID